MSRTMDKVTHTVKSDTLTGQFVVQDSLVVSKVILITNIWIVGHNPADADTDTVAIDVSYSTDGFSASDVEIAVDAAAEYNDTDNTQAFVAETPLAMTLNTTNDELRGGDLVVEVPAGANVKTTITWTGAPADGSLDVVIEYVVVGP